MHAEREEKLSFHTGQQPIVETFVTFVTLLWPRASVVL